MNIYAFEEERISTNRTDDFFCFIHHDAKYEICKDNVKTKK